VDTTNPLASLLLSGRSASSSYDHCHNVRTYLCQRKQECHLSRRELCEQSLQTNTNKFYRLLDGFPNLSKPIPLRILDLFGVKIEIIEFCLELDQDAFDEALLHVHIPKTFTVRWMPAIYGKVSFPEDIRTVEEAIEFARWYSKENKLRCLIDCGGLKQVWINIDNVFITYQRPDIKIEADSIQFLNTQKMGITRLG
jgi:hypothetical protein